MLKTWFITGCSRGLGVENYRNRGQSNDIYWSFAKQIDRYGRERLSWGNGTLDNVVPDRQRYIAALREADHNSYEPLLALARCRNI